MHDVSHNDLRPAASPRLGHVHLEVRDLERSIAFYREVIGLEESERLGETFAFLTSSNDHHTLALQAIGEGAGPAAPGAVGLYHVAFELPSAEALEAALRRLDRRRVPWSAVDHGISWAVYFDDPDGIGLELYVDRRRRAAGRPAWHGTSRPLGRERIRREIESEHRMEASSGASSTPSTPEDEFQRTETAGLPSVPRVSNQPMPDTRVEQ